MDVTGKVCVVTGASSGIGHRTALDLAADGAIVCAAARREDRLKELIAEMGPEAGHSYAVTDVSRRDDVRALADHVRSTYGRCDVLVNNAGFSGEGHFGGPESIPDTEAVMATNFLGTVYCTAELLDLLLASAPSHVVNVASMAGRVATAGNPAYTASKHAVVAWSESVAYGLGPKGVHVSLVEPGPIPTEGFPQADLSGHPLLRWVTGTDADVSRAIRSAMKSKRIHTVTPGFYQFAPLVSMLAPPLVRLVQRRVVAPRMSPPDRDDQAP